MVGGHIGKKQDKASVIWHLISSLLPGYKQVERRTEEERQNTSWQRGKTREWVWFKSDEPSWFICHFEKRVLLYVQCRKPHFANVSMFHIEEHPVIYTFVAFLLQWQTDNALQTNWNRNRISLQIFSFNPSMWGITLPLLILYIGVLRELNNPILKCVCLRQISGQGSSFKMVEACKVTPHKGLCPHIW